MSSPTSYLLPLPEAVTSYFYIVRVCAVCILSCNHPSHHCLAQFRVRMGPLLPASPLQMAFPVPRLSLLYPGAPPAALPWPSGSPFFPERAVLVPASGLVLLGWRIGRPELRNGGRGL